MTNKLTFVDFIGQVAINGHSVEVIEKDDGVHVMRHVRYGWHSGAHKIFSDRAAFDAYIAAFDCSGAKLVSDILCSLGVEGFPVL